MPLGSFWLLKSGMVVLGRGIRVAALLLISCALSLAAAQAIELELGFRGEIVAGSWNPLTLRLRDQPPVELVLEFDGRSSLRQLPKIIRYRAELTGGNGLQVFEDDIFIPVWRTFTWRVQTDDAVLASGSFDRRQADTRPVHLIAGAPVGTWRSLFAEDARVVEVLVGNLPERVAAYSGVQSLVLDGSGGAPRAAAVAAATAAGVTTLLIEPLSPSYESLRALASQPVQRLGAGWLLRASADEAQAALQAHTTLPQEALVSALLTPEMQRGVASPPTLFLLVALGGYALLALLLIRFGQSPGLLSGLTLALVMSLGAWLYLRPETTTVIRARSLSLTAGGLAQVLELRTIFQLPAETVYLNGHAHPLEIMPYTQTPERLELSLARWFQVALALRPQLETARLSLQGGSLHNLSEARLVDAFVIGTGVQPSLAPGASANVSYDEQRDSDIPEVYQQLAAYLPVGSALARNGGHIYVALPTASEESIVQQTERKGWISRSSRTKLGETWTGLWGVRDRGSGVRKSLTSVPWHPTPDPRSSHLTPHSSRVSMP